MDSLKGLLILIIGLVFLVCISKVEAMAKLNLITEAEAIKIGKEYLQTKQYPYAIDWDRPHARMDKMNIKPDGSLTAGPGRRVFVWGVWFLPVEGIDLMNNRRRAGVDINAQTGEIFTKYNLNKF
ncbi:MAG: hypothetical protein JNN05_00035 [Candidatus Omnitrophica bacterium]|nr:hypothetical protein [Candidatus Omnitrophota bacterium]